MLREAVGYDKADLAIACQGLEYRRAGLAVWGKPAGYQQEGQERPSTTRRGSPRRTRTVTPARRRSTLTAASGVDRSSSNLMVVIIHSGTSFIK